MRWRGREQSSNVEDRRGQRRVGTGTAVGGLGALLVLVLALVFNVDPQALMPLVQDGPQAAVQQDAAPVDPREQDLRDFVGVVLKDTEDVWHELFQSQLGREYQEPKLVVYRDSTRSACGEGKAEMGPFYCPLDQTVYIDLGFFEELKRRHGAPGDFAQAYVIAHEVGHHVQNLLGISTQVRQQQARMSREDGNELSVRLELQADFFAGVWAHHADRTKQILEAGDIMEALNAAAAIGDDRLQRESRGFVAPETFTHGTSAQRAAWFRRGVQTGDLNAGDTFSANPL